MLSVNSRRRILSFVMDYTKSHDWTYYDDFPQQVADAYSNLFNSLGRKPDIDEFLKRSEVVKTSFFRLNRISRDEFFSGVLRVIDSISFETNLTGVVRATDGMAQSKSEHEVIMRLSKFEKELNKLVECNLNIAKDIAGIWKELILKRGKMAGLSGDIDSIKERISALVLILKIEENQKKGLFNRIQGISKDIGLNIVADILFEILILASGNR